MSQSVEICTTAHSSACTGCGCSLLGLATFRIVFTLFNCHVVAIVAVSFFLIALPGIFHISSFIRNLAYELWSLLSKQWGKRVRRSSGVAAEYETKEVEARKFGKIERLEIRIKWNAAKV